ncbi:hypothetical protein [Streptomyces sp. WAC00263]|uniref:hypothetical protein n=1 Tax=Streptomyces sp. WAC00263 TaxID=1917422 RepID=UPI00321F907F
MSPRRTVNAPAPSRRSRACRSPPPLAATGQPSSRPSAVRCTTWEELREAHLARLATQRPAVA